MDIEGQSLDRAIQLAQNSLYDLGAELRNVKKLRNRGNAASAPLARGVARLSSQIAESTRLVQNAAQFDGLSSTATSQIKQLQSTSESLVREVTEVQSAVAEQLKRQQEQQRAQQAREAANEQSPLVSGSGGDNYASTDGNGSYHQQQQQQQQQQVLDELDQAEVDLNTALIEGRDAEIAEVQRRAREINAIFQDLGVLVAEQGQQLDTVEDNIHNMARQTESAGRELTKAENYQRSRGKWSCIALCVLLVITILVAAVVAS